MIDVTQENVARALYEVNKDAKRNRDAARTAYNAEDHETKRDHLSKRNRCYDLKNKVLYAAIGLNWVKLDAIHRITGTTNDDDELLLYSRLLACLDLAGFLFHSEITDDKSIAEHEVIDMPPNWRVPAAPEGTQMSLKDAQTLLETFLAKTEDDSDAEIAIDGVILQGARIAVSNDILLEERQSLASSLDELEHALDELEEECTGVDGSEEELADFDDDPGDEEMDAFEQSTLELEGWACQLIDECIFSPDLAKRIKVIEDRILELRSAGMSVEETD